MNTRAPAPAIHFPIRTARRAGSFGAGLAVLALLAGAPTAAAQGVGTAGASAIIRDATGAEVGSATLSQVAGGVRISLSARNLPPGRHGIHLHEIGQCDPPAFTSAGGHFNPTARQHGLSNPQGPHLGDLPELVVAANGTAAYTATNAAVTLAAGASSLLDADGTAIVIHADADDQVTDPTGNSGARIACGALVRGASALPATGTPAHTTSVVAASGAAALLGLIFLRSRPTPAPASGGRTSRARSRGRATTPPHQA